MSSFPIHFWHISSWQTVPAALGGVVLLLATLGFHVRTRADGPPPAPAVSQAADAPLFVLPPQPAAVDGRAPARPYEAWELSLLGARHPEP